ncbi:RNA chaperone Hfq [Sulfobacillus harzensis]|uniref:RNA chaperone Hfq n=1 Tax=Sulfobacillus harzensis TaxID=2729629 RepID=A0A7Y0Q167_9FIRM|nr:RNA chaperone Hfq [Sulfobacillus harzensis]NMP21137.1 hypothetical protein [Sulfobacillus harzensis]
MSRRVDIPPRDTSAPVRIPGAKPTGTKKPSGVFSERHSLAQEPLYQQWVDAEVLLRFVFSDGSALEGLLRAYDTYALQVETEQGLMLVYKQSLRWIAPRDGQTSDNL